MHTSELAQTRWALWTRSSNVSRAWLVSTTRTPHTWRIELCMEFWAFIHFSALISAPRCAFKRFHGILTLSTEKLHGDTQQPQVFTNNYNECPEYLKVLAGIKSKLISRSSYTCARVAHILADCCCECECSEESLKQRKWWKSTLKST